jgi:streptogramin lyase
MKRLALLILLATACATRPPAHPAPAPAAASDPAIERVKGLLAQQPGNTVYLYVLATYYDRAKDAPNVVATLERLDQLGWSLGLGPDSFENSAGNRDFQRVAAKLASREQAVHRATRAFALPADVDSEGVTYDPVGGHFYFSGGGNKLLRVDRAGTISELAVEPFGTAGRLGMDVDAERRHIWTVDSPMGEPGPSAISVHELRGGRLVRRVTHGSAESPSFLNDLTLLKDGTAFVTDTATNRVLRLAPEANAFEVWAEDFRGPNGIAVSADEKTLYVADFRGITAFDIATKSRQLLETDALLNGIDGLIEHRGALVGIQNVLGRPRVVRIYPAEKRVEVLESKNPLLNVPATGVAAGDEYFFLANLGQKGAAERVILQIGL